MKLSRAQNGFGLFATCEFSAKGSLDCLWKLIQTDNQTLKFGTLNLYSTNSYPVESRLMTNSQSKDIDCQSCLLKITCKETCQKTTNWVWNWLEKLGKSAHGETKIGSLVLYHEDIMNLGFGLTMNNRTHLASSQSELLRICRLKSLIENIFCRWNDPGKVWRWIRQVLKICILLVFSVYNIGEQTI